MFPGLGVAHPLLQEMGGALAGEDMASFHVLTVSPWCTLPSLLLVQASGQ